MADIEAFLTFSQEQGFGPLLAHAPYTMNLCAAKPELREFARQTIKEDLARLELLPNVMFNFHPGSHVKQGAETGVALIADALNDILSEGGNTPVLLETMAGKGSEVGRTFEELRAIIDKTEQKERLQDVSACKSFRPPAAPPPKVLQSLRSPPGTHIPESREAS